jgi:hypothetical protein
MSDEDKKTLFQKFGVLESSRNMNHNGLGLGLYISKAILNKLGGDISWQSVIGAGTTFTIKFIVDAKKDVSYLRRSKQIVPRLSNKFNSLPSKFGCHSMVLDQFKDTDAEILEESLVVAKRPYDFTKTNDKRHPSALSKVVRLKL